MSARPAAGKAPAPNVKRGRVAIWTRERLDSLSTPELRVLHQNAIRLGEVELAETCDSILGGRPRGKPVARRASRKGLRQGLVSRFAALGARGVSPASRFWSRGGIRPGDGTVVLVLWAEDARYEAGRSEFLLWAPNVDGSRAWSDSAGGRERLEHCRAARERGVAEGLLAYGVRLEGTLPEEKVLFSDGTDIENIVELRVEQRGEEFWGVSAGSPPAATPHVLR